MEEWLRRRRSGEEKRYLITDGFVNRGWEAFILAFLSITILFELEL